MGGLVVMLLTMLRLETDEYSRTRPYWKGEGVRAYVVYETEEVREGMALGNQELRAQDN